MIKEALELLRASIPSTIEISQPIRTKGTVVFGDFTRIQQIGRGLCTNAYYAKMGRGGVLTVGTEEIDPPSLDSGLSPGPCFVLTVSDTGQGISPGNLDRIFDPYFTSKEKDKGTGLGLAVVRGIVEGFVGEVLVSSTPGEGSTFRLILPSVQTPVDGSEGRERPLDRVNERVLLMDDEPMLAHFNPEITSNGQFSDSLRDNSSKHDKAEGIDATMSQRPSCGEAKGAWAATVVLVVCVIIAWWPSNQAAARTVAKGGRSPVLFLGNASLPPMSFMKHGKPTGIVVDLAEALAARMFHPVEIQLMEWSEAQQRVLDGRADALLQINPNPDRLKIYDFSEPLLTSEFTIFTPAERLSVRSLDDLRGLRVGVEAKGMPISLIKEEPQINTVIIPDFVQGFRMLADGVLDAVIADRWVGSYVLAENNIENVRLIQEPVARSQSAIAVGKGSTELLGEINAALEAIRRDGTYDRIIKSWRSSEGVFRTRGQIRRQTWLLIAISLALTVSLVSVAVLAREIRRRRQVETALRAAEERFRLYMDHSPAIAWMKDEEGRHVYLNKAFEDRFGVRLEDWRGKTGAEFWPEEVIEKFREQDLAVLASGQTIQLVEETVNPDGSRCTWLSSKFPFVDAVGSKFVAGVAIDITERMMADEALRQSEERYRLLVETANEGIWSMDGDHVTTYVNQAMADMLGFSIAEMLGRRVEEFLFPEDRAFHAERMSKRHAGEDEIYERRFRRRDGSELWTLVSAKALKERQGCFLGSFAMFTDITDRKQAEEALAHSRDLMRYIIEHNRSAIAVHDRELRYVFVSQRYLQDYRVKETDVIGKHHYEVCPDVPRKWRDVHQRALAGETLSAENDPYTREDGTVEWTRWECRPWYEADGSIGGIVVYTEVITDRIRAEASLRENEERLRFALETAQMGAWDLDLVDHTAYRSPLHDKIFGYEELLPQWTYELFLDHVHPEDRTAVNDAFIEAVECKEEWSFECRIYRADGELRWIWARGRHSTDDSGAIRRMAGIVQDITERKQAEAALRSSLEEKVSLLMEVHHRVKNNLQIVASLLGLQSSRVQDPQTLEVLQDTENRVRSMALLHEVLYRSENLARIDVATYSQELCRHLLQVFGSTAQQVKLENHIGHVQLPLEQSVPCGLIINELVANALKHGFPDGRPGAVVVDLVPGEDGMLALSVRDNGVGLSRSCDPLQASTLGLKLVSRLAGQLKGHLIVEQAEGTGALFRVVFPGPEETLTEGP